MSGAVSQQLLILSIYCRSSRDECPSAVLMPAAASGSSNQPAPRAGDNAVKQITHRNSLGPPMPQYYVRWNIARK